MPSLQPHPSFPAVSSRRAITACLVTTLLVVLGSYLLPRDWSATGVAAIFLGTTYVLAIGGRENDQIRHYGLSLGGLLETEPLSVKRLLRNSVSAFAYALGTGLVVFPCFAFGFWYWWQPTAAFVFAPISTITSDVLGQLLVVALPEEAFYRGFLQTSLDDAWKKRWRLFGGYLSPGLLVSSGLFAFGHLLTEPNPSRLAVFFPSLLFGWLRTRTSSVGASIVFHALCNLFSSYLGRSFGLWS